VSAKSDAILIEVMRHEFVAISEEMNMTMRQTARSFIAKESSELSAALLTLNGEVMGQGMIFGMGYFTAIMPHLLKKFDGEFRPGDIFLTNDPYGGASHLPDIVMVKPMFWRGEHCGFVAVVEHYTDIGGRYPGGMGPGSGDIFQEGLRLPAVRYYKDGKPISAVREIIAANVRTPDDVLGDLDAAAATCSRGEQGYGKLLEKYGRSTAERCCRRLFENAEQAARDVLRQIPNGSYRAEMVWSDGGGLDVELVLTLKAADGDVVLDFTGTGQQVPKAYNVPPGMIDHVMAGAFLNLLEDPDVPINSGLFSPFKLIVPEGTVFNPAFPAAVAGRGTMIWPARELLYRVLAQALPGRIGAPGEGGTSSMTFSTRSKTRKLAMLTDFYSSGGGGRPTSDGVEGAYSIIMNMYLSTPAELFEKEVPVVLEGCGFVPDTAGAGKFRGSLAVYRQWRFLADGEAILRTVKPEEVHEGREGGHDGTPPEFYLIANGERRRLPSAAVQELKVQAGDLLLHIQHSAGGYGNPLERDPQKVLADVVDEKISVDTARLQYGVVINAVSRSVNRSETAKLRAMPQ
jgi:N-methylhydantoinase B/oxoprolinase/acetone carboxylase alpha subunit